MRRTHRAIAAFLWLAAAGVVAGGEADVSEMRIRHSGTASFGKRGMSFAGIGTTEFRWEDFVLSVKGQFRMQGSARVARSLPGERKKFRVTPGWISLVALGDVTLELPGAEPQRFRAAKAVYLFAEDRWLLDGGELVRPR